MTNRCETCGLPLDLCACSEEEKERLRIAIWEREKDQVTMKWTPAMLEILRSFTCDDCVDAEESGHCLNYCIVKKIHQKAGVDTSF